ncbi:aminodeoxychorismate lyase [Shewanella sp. UCD-KL21]|uniref:aminodeoxychorismate lyase n=1 Tax=Shewanella sp. UCD-KL21 TaxID=1917164 RepID=UPI000970BB5C|nr:aminodeoxychorismate lyase [Shewanella sp. UCD-KL21]
MASVFVNGLPQQQINPLDRGLAYGDGAFATMRVLQGKVLFIDEHIERLQQACLRLGFALQNQLELINQLEQHGQIINQGCIKILISRGVGGRGYTAPDIVEQTSVISLHEIPAHYQQWQQQGISLSLAAVTLARQPLLAGMKHLNRLEQVLIKQDSLPQGCDDWLVLDTDGNVVESSMANVFIVEGQNVYTPAISHSGVSGVMRQQLIIALLQNNINVYAEPISLSRLKQADHVFISNSLLGIININNLDDNQYSSWPMSHNLIKQLQLSL